MRKRLLLLSGKVLAAVAIVFSTMPCAGRMYETEVPKMLRK